MATTNYGLLASVLYEAQTPSKRRCFISYHHADEGEVQTFVDTYSNAEVFAHRALELDMANDIVDSNNTDYVMRRIREQYMHNTSVTNVMVGQNTWKRRYVDWEIAASLRNELGNPANGLLGIKLPSYAYGIQQYPDRLNDNLNAPGVADGTCSTPISDRYAPDSVCSRSALEGPQPLQSGPSTQEGWEPSLGWDYSPAWVDPD